MAAEEKWYFTKEQLANTPSRRCGCEADKELSNRQQAANFIQDMGQRLQVTQLCINTAIVYMHRFYVYHSFTHFHRNAIATAALFLAAKVEEQPRKLEHVIKVAHVCLRLEPAVLDTKSDSYLEQAQDLVFNENVLLQTLSFDVAIDHPHTHVVRCCHMVKASKDLAQTSYFMASNSLHLTTMCLQYKPTVVACFCIHLACKWSNWEIPQSNEGKDWFSYVDKTVTFEQLEQLTTEFLQIFDKCPTKLKRKIMAITASQNQIIPSQSVQSSQFFDNEPRKITETQHSRHPLLPSPDDVARKQPGGAAFKHSIEQYKEKKEKERQEREKQTNAARDSHHSKSVPPLHGPKPSGPAPGPSMAPPASTYRPVVTASREQARREQAHARELIKSQLPSSMFDAVNNHSSTDLEPNRHHSEKYNSSSASKDNRNLDRGKGPPVPKPTDPYAKYNHRKPEDDATKQRGFVPPPQQANSAVRTPTKQFVPPNQVKQHRDPSPLAQQRPMPSPHLPQVSSHHSQSNNHSQPSSNHPSNHSHPVQQQRPPGSTNRVPSTPVPPAVPRGAPTSRAPTNNHRTPTNPSRPPSGSQPRPNTLPQTPPKPKLDLNSSHHTKSDPMLLQRPHLDLNPSQRSHTELNSSQRPHSEVMTSQRSHADLVTSHRSHPEHVSSRSHAEPVTAQRSHVEPVVSHLIKTEPMTSSQRHVEGNSARSQPESIPMQHHAKTEPMSMQRSTDIGRGLADAFRTETAKPAMESESVQSRLRPERETTPPPSRPVKQEHVTPPPPRPAKQESVTPPISRTVKQETITPPKPIRPPQENSITSPLTRPIKQENNGTLSRPNKPETVSPPILRAAILSPPPESPKSRSRPRPLSISLADPMSSPPLPPTPGKGLTPAPELVPYIKKLEEEPGYEHILARRMPDIIQPIQDDLGAVAFPAAQPNGSEADFIKTIIEPSKLLVLPSPLEASESPSKHHKSEKKKKKEKRKHKEKDKDRPREEKKKKHKHKDKDKEKNRTAEVPAPIKITIPKEKILSSTIETNPPQSLKITIHKDRFKIREPTPAVTAPSPLKLKISKDILETYTTPMATKEARKRERKAPSSDERPAKMSRTSTAHNGIRAQMESGGAASKSSSSAGSKHSH